MRAGLINTGTELLLGDVQDAHLAFIAREIFPLGLRIEERRTVPDTDAIGRTLAELFPSYEMLFVTGGLGPTSDDITRETIADLLGLELRQHPELLSRCANDFDCAESNGLRALPVRPMFRPAHRCSQMKTEVRRDFI